MDFYTFLMKKLHLKFLSLQMNYNMQTTSFQLIILIGIFGIFSNGFAQNDSQNQYGTGCNYDSIRYEEVPLTAPLMRGGGLPSSASLKRYAPPPKNQGVHGTCTAWASAYAARTILLAQRQDIDKSAAELAFSPSYVYNQIRLTEDCSYGVYITDALDLLKKKGCVPFRDFGYECTRKVTSTDIKKARAYTIQDYKRLFMRTGNTTQNTVIQPIKKAIAEGKPVIISMRCFASFEEAEDVWNPAHGYDESKGYHAMTVIGYDDTKYGGAVYLMNSWGKNWGRNGFTWVRYSDFATNCMEAYEAVDFRVNPNAPNVSFFGEVSFKKSDEETMEAHLEGEVYRMNETYYTGTAFQFFISHKEPIYMYAIGTDLTGACAQLFPFSNGMSPLLSYSEGTVAFPSEEHFVQLDDTKGSDFICVLYSEKALDIKTITKKMESIKGGIKTRLYEAIGKENISPYIKYKTDKIGFRAARSVKAGTGFIVPLIVEIPHD